MRCLLRLISCVAGIALVACSQLSLKGDGQSANNGGKDTGRPTENGEGVPGYLLGASAIEMSVADATVVLKAPAGTVQGGGGNPSGVRIVIFETTLAAVFEALSGTNGTKLAVTELARTSAGADGSFKVTAQAYQSGVLLVSAHETAVGGAIELSAVGDVSKPSLVFKDPNSPIGFTPLPRPQGDTTRPMVQLQCAAGLTNFGVNTLAAIFHTAKLSAQPEMCICDVRKSLGAQHPMAGFFIAAGHPCRVEAVPKTKEAMLTAGFVETQKGVCLLPTWECNMDKTVLAEAKSKGTWRAAVGLREAWAKALETCKSYSDGTTFAQPADATEQDCAAVRGQSMYAGKPLQGCFLDDFPGGVHPAITAKCIGDSLRGGGGCDYLVYAEDICANAPPSDPVKTVFRE